MRWRTIRIDVSFMSSDMSDLLQIGWNCADEDTGSADSLPVPEKGPSEYAPRGVVAFLEWLAYVPKMLSVGGA